MMDTLRCTEAEAEHKVRIVEVFFSRRKLLNQIDGL